ncbi:hypothetical protein Poly24_31850 [Rosistilla carotiformis]|uniref:Cna protein B-type domain protein n=1 Tax=Rosistilla carotiformis TaxID=2528017 RepID=A0A518JVA6_9BACT|nr:carboxypeptidase-like regulatory domain-containing protein [Rosistilla carotiformis]QDV69469.1 hypothetical protein Poly24_31850 [Rosistilla carotiformis]
MFQTIRAKRAIAAMLCAAVCMQQAVFAAQPQFTVIEGVKVYRGIQDLALDQAGNLNGSIVDVVGQPVQGATVVIGQQTEHVTTVKTNERGEYSVEGLNPGTYQVASFAGLRTFRVWNADSAPEGALKGAIDVTDTKTYRGQCDDRGGDEGLCLRLLKSPLVWTAVIAAAIVIPLALDDDDDAS